LQFDSIGQRYHGEILGEDQVKFFLADPGKLKLNFKVKADHQMITANFIDTGSPHVVINSKDILANARIPDSFYSSLEEIRVDALGREIRWLPEFAPGGTNVNFYELRDDLVYIRTFERGVEAETYACGTGATGTAIIAHLTEHIATPVKLVTKSGKQLQVDFEKIGTEVKHVSLSGPAEFNFNGIITI
jgi:diaminopimelate epimerase